ncbi:MAG: alpha-L-fucosidase [Kiritimatiellae bacterium]|nr:alpha-L-fucosidase [Kiritimatiellia bacterium]MDD5521779.1 alpha-L-fucosidase [Kiritimatiellia bacterium]
MKPTVNTLFAITTVLILSFTSAGITAEKDNPDPAREQRLQWWREARFGMFMHWGIYAVPAGEWKGVEKQKDLWGEWIMERAQIPVSEYEPIAKVFNPVKLNAAEWAKIIRQSGMKYLVITAKHCDGFAMFKSAASRYNIVDATPFAKDPMAELAAALPKDGLRLGFYYSHCWDWHEPDALGHDNRWDFPDRSKKQVERYLRGKSMPQVKELVNQYHPSVIWFDVPSDITRDQSAEFVNIIRSVVPDCIINDRVGNGLGDYGTPEQYIPRRAPARDFEVCMTLNGHWGFDRNDHQWKSADQVIAMLAEIAGKGGNFLLNVGPTAEGLIPEPAQKILREVGQWLEANGESIYGTQAGPLPECPWGWCTVKPGKVYLHILQWPSNCRLFVPGLKNNVRSAHLLSQPANDLKTERVGDRNWLVQIPAQAPDVRDSVLVLDVDGKPEADRTLTLDPLSSVTTRLGCWLAEIHGKGTKIKNLSLETRNNDHIQSWTNSQDWLEWSFCTPLPATYDVKIVYSATGKSVGNEFVFKIGEKEITGSVQDTGGVNNFKEITISRIAVPKTENSTISIKPKSIAGGSSLMQFHALTFCPVTDQSKK